MKRAVFLDRDGTLNVRPRPHEYVTAVEQFEWLPGAREGLARLAAAGYLLAVVSNQRGVARGLVAAEVLRAIEVRMQRDLEPYGCSISAFRYCPHEVREACACRKPRPAMLIDVAGRLGVELTRSWMVGDSASDVLAGRSAGCRTVLLGDSPHAAADLVAPSLLRASEAIANSPQPVER